jgi:hypothetical protein
LLLMGDKTRKVPPQTEGFDCEQKRQNVESRSWLGPSTPMKRCCLKGNKTEADAASRCKREHLAKNGRRATTLLLTFYLLT